MSMHTEIIVAAIGLAGVSLTALLSLLTAWMQLHAKRSLNEVNDAVNNRHAKGYAGAPKLYDLAVTNHAQISVVMEKVDELVEWKNSYANGPMDTGAKVMQFVEDNNQRLDNLHQKIEDCGCPYRMLHGPQPPDVNCGRGLPDPGPQES